MKRTLQILCLLIVVTVAAIVPSPPFNGQVTLEISVPGPLNSTNRFVIVGSPTVSSATNPVTSWPVLASVPGNVTNPVVSISPTNQQYFFACTETNKYMIGPFSEVAVLDLPRTGTVTVKGVQ